MRLKLIKPDGQSTVANNIFSIEVLAHRLEFQVEQRLSEDGSVLILIRATDPNLGWVGPSLPQANSDLPTAL